MSIVLDGDKGVTQNTTEAARLPSGTTAERPANPVAGMIRFNTDFGYFEGYDPVADDWFKTSGLPAPLQATGGTETTITDNGVTYKVHTFTSSGTFEVTQGEGEVEYLVVGGGGSGAAGRHDNSTPGGGGGAGGLLEATKFISTGSFSVVVGAGGASVFDNNSDGKTGNRGIDSSFGSVVAPGGQGSLSNSTSFPRDFEKGGSGGGRAGGGVNTSSANQGGIAGSNGFFANNGGDKGPLASNASAGNAGGGGGGAGAAGQDASENNGGDGGSGVSLSISGTTVTYAGGGGGAGASAGSGGAGGGGGGSNDSNDGSLGGQNTGGGGGGNRTSGASGSGGSGIVIIRYPI